MTESIPWYQLSNPDQIDSPALLIFKDRVEHNIRKIVKMVDDVRRLRPHVKTHKSPEVTKLLMAAGIDKFKCATISELEMLSQLNAKDVLLAYQPTGPKQDRILSLQLRYPATTISCLIDHIEIARQLNAKVSGRAQPLDIYIDLNVGMNRTGIRPGEVPNLYRACQALTGLRIAGLHVYDGHFRQTDFAERKSKCDTAFAEVRRLASQLDGQGNLQIIAGGSPTFPIHAQRQQIQCSPGTFIYWDLGYGEKLPEQPFIPAAVVMSRIISLPDATKICLDLGHKSIASENPLDRRIKFLNAPNLSFIGHSEEHLVAEAGKNHRWKIGDVLYGVPIHICPTVALHDEVHVIVSGALEAQWPTLARSRRLNI